MRGLLVRVAADQSGGGGHWNGPVNSKTGGFVYVAIPESTAVHPGHEKPYADLGEPLGDFGMEMPAHLATRNMHLDPDFDHLTYGDAGERAKQIRQKIGPGDILVFYAGLKDVHPARHLVYALIGLYVVDEVILARDVPIERRSENAHTRRILSAEALDVIVRGRPSVSGRLGTCIPIGDYREGAYRVWPDTLDVWGGLGVKNGYLQRSARLPVFNDAERFYDWFQAQDAPLIQSNN